MTDQQTDTPDIAGLRRTATIAGYMGEPVFAAKFNGAANALEALQAERDELEKQYSDLLSQASEDATQAARMRAALEEIGEKIKESGNTGMAAWVQDRVQRAREFPQDGRPVIPDDYKAPLDQRSLAELIDAHDPAFETTPKEVEPERLVFLRESYREFIQDHDADNPINVNQTDDLVFIALSCLGLNCPTPKEGKPEGNWDISITIRRSEPKTATQEKTDE